MIAIISYQFDFFIDSYPFRSFLFVLLQFFGLLEHLHPSHTSGRYTDFGGPNMARLWLEGNEGHC